MIKYNQFGVSLRNFMTFRQKFWIWQPFCESASNFFQLGIFAHYDVSLLNRLIDSRKNVGFLVHFHRIYQFWKFQSDLKILKNSPPPERQWAWPPLREGPRPLRAGRIFQNFSRIDALGQCWEAIMSQIREKSLVGKKFDTLSLSAVVLKIFVRFSWNFTHSLQIGCNSSSSSRETILWIFQKLFDIE